MILAIGECDAENEIICVPETVNELFELPFVGGVNRTILLIALAAIIVIALLYFGIVRQKNRLVPTKFGAFVETLVSFVRDEIAIGIIGPEHGLKYYPWLLSVFMFVLVGNLFEVTPFINFPITSRIAIPLFLALLTWVIFVVSGFKEQGFGYLKESLFPPGVPKPLYLLVTPIEFVSTFLVRPFSLAVRLFANLVAGHVMLSLLLVSGWVFISAQGGIAKIPIGVGWFALGLGIFVFEIIVAMLQAYIFTLLSAVYVQTSVHPEH
ncbi:MAG: F0F1 ATP synthase subunit A [Acidimicrobiia bacterium]|nr:F0F1 ATP synthase subunit A [Acidimicrobiia bacterium]NNC75562.1 F0F1 ATP synthase subunit A [Acidimicrobiia bacterium]